jgi:hypothetical protein
MTGVRKRLGEARKRTVVVLAIGSAALAAAGAALATVGVSLTGSGPQPATVTIPWGETVVFGNDSGLPQVIEIPRETYTSETIPPGGALSYVFDGRAGPYVVRQVGTQQVHQGRVVVELDGALTFSGPDTVTYGRRAVVRGTSTVTGSPPVSIMRSRPDDPAVWDEVTTAEVAEDGSFVARLELETGGRFRAEAAAGQVRSTAVRISVRPTIAISVADRTVAVGRVVRVSGRLAPAGAASRAQLEIYNAERKRWVRVDSARVSASGTVALSFRLEQRGKTRVRVALQRTAVTEGFTASSSRWVVVTAT